MDIEREAFYWTRLARAVVREEFGNLTGAQRTDLIDSIRNDGAEGDLAAVVDAFEAGILTDEVLSAGYRAHVPGDFDPAAWKEQQAPAPDTSAAQAARLTAIIREAPEAPPEE